MESINSSSIIVILLGVISLLIAFQIKRRANQAGNDWPTAAGVILSSEVVRDYSDDTPSYQPAVVYEFQVGGTTYTGKRVGLGSAGYRKKQAKKTAAAYPVGSAVTVYYDPSNPSKCALETEARGVLTYIIIGIALIAIGIFMVF